MGGLVDGLMGGGDEADTSGMNQAAVDNAALSKEALAWAKQRYAEEAPTRQAAVDMAMKTAQQQYDISKQNADISKDYYDYQKGTFRPLEQGIVKAAEEYDTTARREQKAGQAVAGVNTQIDNARTAMRERMASRGIDLGGGNVMAQEAAMAVQGGAAAAAAANKAREDVELQGYARKMDAASLGRNLPNNQATSAGVAVNAGNSSVANAQVPVAVGQNATSQVTQGLNFGVQANQSAGNLYGQKAQIDSGGGAGNTAALMAGAGGIMQGLGAMGYSSKKLKTKGGDVDSKKALAAVVGLDVDRWKYKPGVADEGEHVGPYAEDVQRSMGDEVAPRGQMIDLAKSGQVNRKAIQELAGQLQEIESLVAELRS